MNYKVLIGILLCFLLVGCVQGATYLDSYNTNLKFLEHFNGTDGAYTDRTDSTGRHTVTFTDGGALNKISTTDKKFGVSSYYVDSATTRGITITGSTTDAAFGTSNYTVMFWGRLVADTNPSSFRIGSFNMYYNGFAPNIKYYCAMFGGAEFAIPRDGAWHQYVITRTGTGANLATVYIDGSSVLTTTDSTNYGDPGSTNWKIGLNYDEDPMYFDEYSVWSGVSIPISELYPQTYEVGQSTTLPTPVASFTSTNISAATNSTTRGWEGLAPFTMSFTNTSSYPTASDTWVWNYTELATPNTPVTFNSTSYYNPIQSFNTGNYSIKLNVTGSMGNNISTQTTWINVTQGINYPIASFTQNKTGGQAPLPVYFTDTSTVRPKVWNWSVNSSDWSSRTWYNYTTSTNLEYTFPSAGLYNVTLSVQNITESPAISTVSHDVLVNATLAADFVGAPTSGTFAPQTVSFVDFSTGAGLYAWSWNFGDGSTSTTRNPTHQYVSAGSFTVSLTTSGADGTSTKTVPNYINIGTGNIWTANQTSSYKYAMPVLFNDTSPAGHTMWNWSFGDGYWFNTSTASLMNATHFYSVANSYNVALTVTDPTGTNTSTQTNAINLYSDDDTNLYSWLHFNGANGGVLFPGEKGTAWTPSSVTTSTTQVKFGSASALFNAAGDHLDTATSTAFDMGVGDFTIEMWVFPTSTGTNNLLFTRATNALNTGWGIYHGAGATSSDWHFYGGSTATRTPAFTLPLNTWSHLAVQRVSGSVTPYVNGVAATAPTTLAGNYDTTNAIRFGDTGVGVISYEGYIDEFRFSKTPRWNVGTDSFSTPYAEYRGNISVGWVENNPGSTMRYKTNPDFPGATMSNLTARSRTLQIQYVNITDRINATMTFNPNHFFASGVTANTTMLAGTTLTYSSIDNDLGEVFIGLDRVGGFSSTSYPEQRLSVADIRMVYTNYSRPSNPTDWSDSDPSNVQYFSNGYLTNTTSNFVFGVHNFIGTNVTVRDWVTYSDFAANNIAPVLGESPVWFTTELNQTTTETLWDWGDGSPVFTSRNTSETHIYPTSAGITPKTVTATARLYQNTSVTNTTTRAAYITPVYNASLVQAAFTGTPESGNVGTSISFTDQSIWGTSNALSGRTYNWSFGDVGVSLTPFSSVKGDVNHVYSSYGTYTVTLAVNNTIANSTVIKENYIIISSSTQSVWYTPKQISISVMSHPNGNIVPNATISLAADGTSLQDNSQLQTMYGINPSAANQMVNGTLLMNGVSGGDGGAVFTVLASIRYTARVTDPTTGKVYSYTLNPGKDPYTLWVGTSALTPNATASSALSGTALYVTQPDVGNVTLNLRYQDTSGYTTNVLFLVKSAGNNTVIYQEDLGNPGTGVVYANHTHRNIRGDGYYWYYNATRDAP